MNFLGLNKYDVLHIVILVILPFSFFLINPLISFANMHACDSWFYFGLYHHLDWANPLFTTYHISRLPAILPGFFFYKFLPSMTAHYALFFFYYYIAVLCLYTTIKLGFSSRCAIVVCVFFATNHVFLAYLSVDYISAPTLAYGMLALALITISRIMENTRASQYFILASGGAFAGVIHCHFMALCFFFFVPLTYLSTIKIHSDKFWKEVKELFLYFSTGILISTTILGIINSFFFDGQFLFFLKQIEFAMSFYFLTDTPNPYRVPSDHWITASTPFSLALLGVLLGIYYFVHLYYSQHRKVRFSKSSRYVTIYLLVFIALVFCQIKGIIVFEYSKYSVWLLPSFYLAVIPVLFDVGVIKSNKQFYIMFLIVLFLGLTGIHKGSFLFLRNYLFFGSDSIFIPIAIGIVAVVLAYNRTFPKTGLFISWLLLLLIQAGVVSHDYGRQLWNGATFPTKTFGWDYYNRIHDGVAFLSDFGFKERPKFWIKETRDVWEVVAYPRSFLDCHYMNDFPEINADYLDHNDLVVMIDTKPNIIDRANEELRKLQMTVSLISLKTISYNSVTYQIMVGKVSPRFRIYFVSPFY